MRVYFNQDTIQLLYFLFPGYKTVTDVEWSGASGKVIYFVQPKDKIVEIDRQMQHRFTDYVIVTKNDSHIVDRKFDNSDSITKYVSEIKRLRLTKVVEKYACPPVKEGQEQKWKEKKIFTDQEFFFFIKMSIVLGRWYHELFEKQERMYQLFEALRESKEALVAEYFLLRKRLSANEIFSSVLTMLYKFKSKDNRKDKRFSDYYLRLLASLENVIKPESIPVVLSEVIRIKNEVPMDSRVLYFLLALRG